MFWILAAAGVDKLCRQLPDALVLLALLPTAMAAAALTLQGSPTAVTSIGIGAALWTLPLLVIHVFAPAGVGFGDVKAAGAIGVVLGLTQHAVVVAAGLVAAAIGATVSRARSEDRQFALGPYLAGGAVACLAVGSLAEEMS
jgi:leader peptidase (prepilin peptidase)/N-methyltransferase